MHVIKYNEFNKFNNITLDYPSEKNNDNMYFCKILNNNNNLLIQTPALLSRNGIVKNYIDILVEKDSLFSSLFQNIDKIIKKKILEEQLNWFENSIEDEIDFLYSDTLKLINNKYFFRVYLKKNNSINKLKIFNNNKTEIPISSFNKTNKFICILNVSGLIFNSSSLKIEYNINEMLIVDNDYNDSCIVDVSLNHMSNSNNNLDEVEADESETDESETDESETDESETDESETDESDDESEKVIEETPAEPEKVIEETPVVEKVIEETPAEPEKVVEETPVVEKVIEETPAEPEKVVEETPVVEKVIEETPAEPEKVVEETPAAGKVIEETPAAEKVVEETPAELGK
jgi:hypothetical protein